MDLSAPGGVQRTRTFDLLDHLVHETGTGAEAPTTARTFDHDPLGRLITSSAPGGENRFAYNDRGALLSTGGPSGDTNFAYDADGNLTTRTDAAGTATYGYTNGRLSTIQDGLTNVTQTLSYNNADQLSDVDYGGGRARELSYDQFGRLDRDELNVGPNNVVRSLPTVVAAVDYGYDNGDRLTTKETTGLADAGVNTYGYDQADRLTSWTHDPTGAPPATTTTYGWDGASNRVSVGAQTATFDERNRLLNDGTSTYGYTPRGTLSTVARGTDRQTVAFDAFDRLTSQGTTNYSYDALDRVAARNGQQFAYTGASNELASDGATKFSRGPGDELLALQSGPNKRLTMADQHGDLIAGFDPAASLTQVADSTAYDPFGAPTATTGTKRPIGHQGDYTDPDTGQVNMTARWYTPRTGTFTSRDDIQLPETPASAANRYTYTGGSPINRTDPTGHDWLGGGPGCLPPEVLVFAPCGNGNTLGGGVIGSGGGVIIGPGTGPGRGGVGSGGAGGSDMGNNGQLRPPPPDPSKKAREANREAARNNPLPIPNAMLAPLYGGSTTAPVSSAPDIPSNATDDYRDPVDDVNRTYQELQDSLTVDNQTLLGTVKDTTSAPTEVTPANYQPDQNTIDDMIGDAYKNGAGQCAVFEGDAYEQTCIENAPNPNFKEDLSNQALLEGLEYTVELLRGAAILGLGLTAAALCALSAVCGGVVIAGTPEFALLWPMIYRALMAARGLGLLGGAAKLVANGGLRNPLALVPKGARMRQLIPVPGKVEIGVEYSWRNASGQTVRLRIHGPDASAPAGSNSATGPTYRIQVGSKYMDLEGNLYPPGVHKPASPHYDPGAADATHIPWPEGVPLPWER